MKTYALRDIFKFIIAVEEEGNAFYKAVATATEGKLLKDLFISLSKQEVKHAKIFLKLYKSYDEKGVNFTAGEELSELLDTLMRGLLFPDISEVRDALRKKRDLVSVIKIAMDVELNTILFYQRIKELLAQKQTKAILQKVIAEEEKHLIRLKNTRLEFDALYAGLRYGKFF